MTANRWDADGGHSGIHFSVRHLVISKVRGHFARWTANVVMDENDPSRAKVAAVIDVSSITTGVADRDKHLLSADFFDVANYPEISFTSTHVEKLAGGRLQLAGNLTIRGRTREIVLDVEDNGRTQDPWGHERAGYSAKVTIERKDFGLAWNQVMETGGVVVGDRVDIEIEVEAVRQVAEKAA
jgi:polyisoprenoid-binding protein YceI